MTHDYRHILPVFEREGIITANELDGGEGLQAGDAVSLLIVVNNAPLNEEDRVQLGKIMQACGLSENSWLIASIDRPWLHYRHLNQIKTVLLFGVKESNWSLNIILPYHKTVKFDNRTWIKTVSIPELAGNQQAKAELWNNALKSHFK